MNKKVLIPGTYDPVTYGHIFLFETAQRLFDEIYIGIFINPNKHPMFSLESRLDALKFVTKDIKNVHVFFDDGFVSDYAKNNNIDFILKGFRNDIDYKYEKEQAIFNKERTNVDTLLIPSKDFLSSISSTIVRTNISSVDDLKKYIPIELLNILKQN